MEVVFSLSSITFIYITVFWCVILTSVSVFPVLLQDFSEPPVTFLSNQQKIGGDLRTWTSCPSFFWDSLHGRFLYWIFSFCSFMYFYYYRNTKSHSQTHFSSVWVFLEPHTKLHQFAQLYYPTHHSSLSAPPVEWDWRPWYKSEVRVDCDYPVVGIWRVNYLRLRMKGCSLAPQRGAHLGHPATGRTFLLF